jgi:predicted NACHT family NTPase
MARTIEFVKKLCANLNIASRIIEDLKKSQLFREMPRSPIAAILLAKLINENPKDIPSSLTELYSQYTELILGRWEIDKGLETQKEY